MVLELLFEYGEHESSSVAQILNGETCDDRVTSHNLELRDKMALKTSLILLLSFISMHLSYSAKIAGFSGVASGSHYFNLKKVMEELVSRGHEVRSIEQYLLVIYGA